MSAYAKLEQLFHKRSVLSGASAILHWDNAVMMPDGGAESRSEQLATLGLMSHELLKGPAVENWLEEASSETLDDWQTANLKEMNNQWRHGNAVDGSLVEALSRATSQCEMTWRAAREENDFSVLQEELEKVVSLTQEMALAKAEAFGVTAYDALLDQFEPGCTAEVIDVLFDDLGAFLPGFLDQVLEKQRVNGRGEKPEGPFPIEVQRDLGEAFMRALTFDFNHGRLDTSHHPFTGGTPDDVRLTTRYEEDDFTQSLMGTLHETGHALYEQNLPLKWRHQPVGQARGMAMHESQSLLIEMQLSRGSEFLQYAIPIIRDAFKGEGENWTFANLKQFYHRVERGFIRVDADEVTYPLHVILRYRLEKALLSGDLKVKDLPGAWNEGMMSLLGVTPPNDRLGCLQDIHWPGGAIGYFPTYTMGALAAAQLFEAARNDLSDMHADIRAGKFEPLVDWLKKHVHQMGSLKSTDQMLEDATGKKMGTEAFKAHLTDRYLKG
ncbi:carboxypeptidase M32 [Sneathiella sp.]|jgi:carboxypeptidase Taq|uniref:carboxypeptidase M32 n=1 Tax=Sneathiella sp. TaxID=1964365 RepID=UPI0039E4E041